MYPESYWKKLVKPGKESWFGSKYLLRAFLGCGAFGAVFRADEMLAGRVIQSVAIKIVIADLDNLDRQIEELQLTVRLRHPHLISGITCEEGEIDGDPCLGLVMELADESLGSYLKNTDSDRLPPETVKTLIKHIAEGLAFLHSQQPAITHRDLKPDNILRVGNLWKLGDFGIARSLKDGSFTYTQAIGTGAYMPPESYHGNVSPSFDIWSLGVAIVELLAGQHPFPAETMPELMRKVMSEEPELPPELRSPFREIAEGCLIKERENRWTAQQVREVLDQTSATLSPLLIIERLPGGIKLELIKIPAGSFLMGSPNSDSTADDSEKPQHQVNLKEFYLGKYPVTQEQYQAVMGNNPSGFQNNPKNPIERVSWDEAQEFCQKLSQQTGKTYRLPSEAEWEYACRGGAQTRYYFGDNKTQLGEYAWYADNSGDSQLDSQKLWVSDLYNYWKKLGKNNCQTHPVGQKKANPWGLYDMYGNVWEWCEDEGAPIDGSPWKDNYSQSTFILRGGSWSDYPRNCRSASRKYGTAGTSGLTQYGRLIKTPNLDLVFGTKFDDGNAVARCWLALPPRKGAKPLAGKTYAEDKIVQLVIWGADIQPFIAMAPNHRDWLQFTVTDIKFDFWTDNQGLTRDTCCLTVKEVRVHTRYTPKPAAGAEMQPVIDRDAVLNGINAEDSLPFGTRSGDVGFRVVCVASKTS